MTTKAGELADLKNLTGMILDTELAVLQKLNAECAAEASRLALLDQDIHDQMAVLRNIDDANILLVRGSEHLWQDKARQKRAEINQKAAQLAAEREAQLTRSRLALGRVQAVAALRGKLQAAATLQNSRRDRVGPT